MDRLASIAEMWAEGWTTAEIGEWLGVTKNSVCGAVFVARKGGDMRFPTRPYKRADKTSPAAQAKRPPPAISEAPEARPRGVPFVEVWADGCRFELGSPAKGGKFQFCNAKTELGAWCAEHWPRVYNFGARQTARMKNSSP